MAWGATKQAWAPPGWSLRGADSRVGMMVTESEYAQVYFTLRAVHHRS